MSPIGRIFIVLNLVLAVAFLGWASSNLANGHRYKADLEAEQAAHQATRESLQSDLDSITNDRNNFERDLSSMRGERDNFMAERDRLAADLLVERERNAELAGRLDSIDGTLQSYQSTNQDLADKLERANDARVAAEQARHTAENERAEALDEQKSLADQLRVAKKDVGELQEGVTSAKREIADLETQVQTFVDVFGVTAGDLVVQKQVDGAVLMVSYAIQPGLISINRGKNDGVERGYTFEIYSGGQYKGRARVETVQDDMCTAVILKTYQGRTIEQGDSATTRI